MALRNLMQAIVTGANAIHELDILDGFLIDTALERGEVLFVEGDDRSSSYDRSFSYINPTCGGSRNVGRAATSMLR